MRFCDYCKKAMVHVQRFKPDGAFELYQCPNCHSESREKRVDVGKITFGSERKPTQIKKGAVKHSNSAAKKPASLDLSKKHTIKKKGKKR